LGGEVGEAREEGRGGEGEGGVQVGAGGGGREGRGGRGSWEEGDEEKGRMVGSMNHVSVWDSCMESFAGEERRGEEIACHGQLASRLIT